MTCKKLTGHTPFFLVYGKEAVMLMEYIVLSLTIVDIIEMEDVDDAEERLLELVQLEEERFFIGYH